MIVSSLEKRGHGTEGFEKRKTLSTKVRRRETNVSLQSDSLPEYFHLAVTDNPSTYLWLQRNFQYNIGQEVHVVGECHITCTCLKQHCGFLWTALFIQELEWLGSSSRTSRHVKDDKHVCRRVQFSLFFPTSIFHTFHCSIPCSPCRNTISLFPKMSCFLTNFISFFIISDMLCILWCGRRSARIRPSSFIVSHWHIFTHTLHHYIWPVIQDQTVKLT